jgi:hypothetical protein
VVGVADLDYPGPASRRPSANQSTDALPEGVATLT